MPPRSERVVTMVRAELKKDPRVTNDELLKKARVLDGSLRRMSPRQFHGTYRLPAARAAKLANPDAASPASRPRAGSARSVPQTSAPPPAPSVEPNGAAPAGDRADAPAAAKRTRAYRRSSSTATTQPQAAQREAIRQILQTVAREALATEDRASFIRLLDSLDERAGVVLGMFGRA